MLADLERSGLLPGSQVFLRVEIVFCIEILAETQLVQVKRVGLFQLQVTKTCENAECCCFGFAVPIALKVSNEQGLHLALEVSLEFWRQNRYIWDLAGGHKY